MRRRIRKHHGLKLRRYTDRSIDLNKYLASFPGANMTDKIGVAEINESLLNIMSNSWSKQAYVQVFDCKYITFKKGC